MAKTYFLKDKNNLLHQIKNNYKIGSAQNNDLILVDNMVKNRHCTIQIRDQQAHIIRYEDAKISVRTKVIKEQHTKLNHYDMVTVGRHRLRFIEKQQPNKQNTDKLWANDQINAAYRNSVIKYATKNGKIDAESQTTVSYFDKKKPKMEVKPFNNFSRK